MKIYEKADFIAFARTKGDEGYRGGDMCNCALTQFMRSKDHRVRRSYIDDSDKSCRIGTNDFGETIVGLRITEKEAMAIVTAETFDKAIEALENP